MRKHRFFCASSADEARFNPLIASKKAAALKAAKLFQSCEPHLLGITSAPCASYPQSTASRLSKRCQIVTPNPKGLQLWKIGRPDLVYSKRTPPPLTKFATKNKAPFGNEAKRASISEL
jgi:hypothetical protein